MLKDMLIAGVERAFALANSDLTEEEFVPEVMRILQELSEEIKNNQESYPTREYLAKEVAQTALRRGEFTLKSGGLSNFYFDKYLIEAKPALLRRLALCMAQRIPGGTQVLAGLEMGGIPLVTLLSSITGIPAAFVRKERKTYGTCFVIEGTDIVGKQVCIVEDVVTSGGAVFDGAHELRESGALVHDAICLIARWRNNSLTRDGAVGFSLDPALAGFELRELTLRPLYTLDDLGSYIEEAKK